MVEEWRDIKDYEGLYQVSNTGKIKSLYRDTGKILTGEIIQKGKGYLRVELTQNKKVKRFLVHRLVAQAFIPNPENKPEVNHIDGNTLNNNASNLEWCTHRENINHAWETGLNENQREKLRNMNPLKARKYEFAEKRKKPIIQMDLDNNFIREFNSAQEATKYYGIKDLYKHISACCVGRRKTAYGYKWRYKGEMKNVGRSN